MLLYTFFLYQEWSRWWNEVGFKDFPCSYGVTKSIPVYLLCEKMELSLWYQCPKFNRLLFPVSPFTRCSANYVTSVKWLLPRHFFSLYIVSFIFFFFCLFKTYSYPCFRYCTILYIYCLHYNWKIDFLLHFYMQELMSQIHKNYMNHLPFWTMFWNLYTETRWKNLSEWSQYTFLFYGG